MDAERGVQTPCSWSNSGGDQTPWPEKEKAEVKQMKAKGWQRGWKKKKGKDEKEVAKTWKEDLAEGREEEAGRTKRGPVRQRRRTQTMLGRGVLHKGTTIRNSEAEDTKPKEEKEDGVGLPRDKRGPTHWTKKKSRTLRTMRRKRNKEGAKGGGAKGREPSHRRTPTKLKAQKGKEDKDRHNKTWMTRTTWKAVKKEAGQDNVQDSSDDFPKLQEVYESPALPRVVLAARADAVEARMERLRAIKPDDPRTTRGEELLAETKAQLRAVGGRTPKRLFFGLADGVDRIKKREKAVEEAEERHKEAQSGVEKAIREEQRAWPWVEVERQKLENE